MEWFPCPTIPTVYLFCKDGDGVDWFSCFCLAPQFELIHYLAERERERERDCFDWWQISACIYIDSNLVKSFWDIHHTVHVKLSFTNLNLLLIIFPVGFVIIMFFLMSEFGIRGDSNQCLRVCVFLGICNHYYYFFFNEWVRFWEIHISDLCFMRHESRLSGLLLEIFIS